MSVGSSYMGVSCVWTPEERESLPEGVVLYPAVLFFVPRALLLKSAHLHRRFREEMKKYTYAAYKLRNPGGKCDGI